MASIERNEWAGSGLLGPGGTPVILSPSGELADRLAEITRAARRFFAFPEPMKRRSGPAEWPTGYRDARARYSPSFAAVQRCETFTVRRCDDEAVRSRLHGSAEALYDSMFDALNEFDELAQTLLHRAGVWTVTQGESLLRVAASASDAAASPYLEEPHVDPGLLTITTASSCGLVLRDKSNRDAPVTMPPNDLVVLPGRRLAELAKGRIEPMMYAVRSPRGCADRLSITYIVDADGPCGG